MVAVPKVVRLPQLFKHPAAQPTEQTNMSPPDHGGLNSDVRLELVRRGVIEIRSGVQPVMGFALDGVTLVPGIGHAPVILDSAPAGLTNPAV